MNLVFLDRESQPVRVLKSDVDPVRVVELMPIDALPVDEQAVPAIQVLDEIFAILGDDARVSAGRAVVAKD